MRFADAFHERIYRVSKFNARDIKDKDKKNVEMCSIKLANYIIYSIDYGDRWGYCVEKPQISSTIYKRIVIKQPKDYKDINEIELAPWYIEFEKLEKNLEPLLKEAEKHESELFRIANDISAKITT